MTLTLADRQEARGLAQALRRQRPSRALADQAAAFLERLVVDQAAGAKLSTEDAGLLFGGVRQAVARQIAELEDPWLKLVAVYDVVEALEGIYGRARVFAELLLSNERGEIELRPSAGEEFTSRSQLERCPPGPRGTRLVFLRRLGPGRG